MLVREDNGYWELPGGAVEFGENYKDCLAREIKEEMNLDVTWVDDKPLYFSTFQNFKGVWAAIILFEAKVKDLNFSVSNECQEIGFFDKESASKLQLFPSVKAFINS